MLPRPGFGEEKQQDIAGAGGGRFAAEVVAEEPSIVFHLIFMLHCSIINSSLFEMKALLGMAREKRKEENKEFKPLSKLNLKRPEPEPDSYLDDDEEDYEPDEEEIIAYA